MKPLVFPKRVDIPGGLWSDKVGGDFQEGDPAKTNFFVEGRCEIKERAGRLRMFFQNIRLKKRRIVISDADKEAFIKTYRAERGIEENTTDATEGMTTTEQQQLTPDEEEEKRKEAEDEALSFENYVNDLQKKELVIPRLMVFMSKKSPKKRMTDLHRTGSRVYLNVDSEGLFGKENTLGNFEATLKDIYDALDHLGVVILKMPQDKPVTEEPIIYGFVKLQSSRFNQVKTLTALNLTEISETLAKVSKESESNIEEHKSHITDVLKPLSVYSNVASRAWVAFQKEQDDRVDYKLFLKMLDYSEIFLVDSQAQRLCEAINAGQDETLGIIEFENFLMAYDVLGQGTTDLLILDVYDSLKFRRNTGKSTVLYY